MSNTTALYVHDARSLRDAFGAFPTGVAVITSVTRDGERLGATVSSFSSVSLDPPLVLFSMARIARGFSAWAAAESFAVNVLHEEQAKLSSQFAQSLTDKWCNVEPGHGAATGVPLLPDALAWFECKTWARYDGGDHLIIVGEIVSFARSSPDVARPLVFFSSKYARLET